MGALSLRSGRRRAGAALCASVWAGVSCTPSGMPADSGGGPTTLDPERILLPAGAWTLVPGDDHPFADTASAAEDCPSVAYKEEAGFFEVESDQCAFGVFTQPLATGIDAGETVEFVAWHLDLWAPEPAEARVVMQIGAEVLWEQVFPVPGPEDIQVRSFTFTEDVPAGTPAWWHVANHGYNSWRVGDVETVLPEGASGAR